MTAFMKRRAAIACQAGQAGIDFIIPVLLEKTVNSDPVSSPTEIKLAKEPSMFEITPGNMRAKISGKKPGKPNPFFKDAREAFSLFPRMPTQPVEAELEKDDSNKESISDMGQESEKLDHEESEINEDRITYILIQVKNYRQGGSAGEELVHFNPITSGIESKVVKRPFVRIGLWFLGDKKEFSVKKVSDRALTKEQTDKYKVADIEELTSLSCSLINPHLLIDSGDLAPTIEAILDSTRDPARLMEEKLEISMKKIQMFPAHGSATINVDKNERR